MSCPSLPNYILTGHALLEMRQRNLTEADITAVLEAPEQSEEIRPGRCVYQSRLNWGDLSKTYLLRVFVDVDRDPLKSLRFTVPAKFRNVGDKR